MLRQELQTTRETLAARDAELQELKSRVADLERLQTDQQKLIALKDAELNAAQQRTGQAAATADTVVDAGGGSALPWISGGALVLLGLAAMAWARRRRASASTFRTPAEARPSIADAFVPADSTAGPSAAGQAATAPVVSPVVDTPPAPTPAAAPSWERGGARRASGKRPAAVAAPPASPAWAKVDAPSALAPQVEPVNAERLELAQAYLDMGDTERARQLLVEVEESSDSTARSVASRMRQGMG